VSSVLEDVSRGLDSPLGWAEFIFTALALEVQVWLMALGMMSWSARDEPIRASHRRALRRLYLLTPHAATVVALTGAAIVWTNRLDQSGYDYLPTVLFFLAFTTTSIWSLWIVLRTVGCRGASAMCRWPARCEECGYQLAGTHQDSDCPECGLAVVKTLGENVRPGIEPARQGLAQTMRYWLEQTYRSVRRPTSFGKTLHVLSPDLGHRRCLAITLTVLLISSPVAVAGLYVVVESTTSISSGIDWEEVAQVALVGGTIMGLMIVAVTTSATLGGAGLIGSVTGKRHGRNLMPAAVRAACYQSGFAVLWSAIFWINLLLFMLAIESNWLDPIAARYNFDPELLAFAWLFGVVGLGVLIYLALIARATTAARFANW